MRKATIIIFALVLGTCSRPPGTMEEILSSGELRVVTRNSPTTYFSGAGGYEGPEYLLVNGFADYLTEKYGRPVEARFDTIDRLDQIFDSLQSGRAHLAAAGLTVTPEREKRILFGPAYQEVKQLLIYKLNSGRPRSLAEIQGKRLEIMAGSSFAERLAELQDENPELAWTENPNADVSDLLLAVEEQRIDYTVADSTDFHVYRQYLPDLRVAIPLQEHDTLAWGFAKNQTGQLRADADEYFAGIEASGKLKQILERYYGHRKEFDYVGTRTFIRHHDSRLDNFRPLFEAAGEATETDWRLLAAIGYQESHWNPDAVSPTGVRGVMMLTRNTANNLGVNDRRNPAESIPAGARYFARLRKRLSDIPEPDRTWFALAAYNIGYGHLRDAQRIVRMQGGDPERWVDVKDALPLLAQQKWHSKVPSGYARGWVPVQYVSNVRTYFEILNWLTANKASEAPGEQDLAPRDTDELQTASAGQDTNSI